MTSWYSAERQLSTTPGPSPHDSLITRTALRRDASGISSSPSRISSSRCPRSSILGMSVRPPY
ncbi:hypothetical protein AB0D65_29945 [Streptomyces griseoloalbus]|uniref:Uncharacterized protein n=1 Tax=Streptomyces griseoloalbus TaxID=67303 RepID=A0ABV3EF08_9ACTN